MKKILAILLTVCMVVCMIPATAFAGGESGNENLIDLTQATISIDNGGKDTIPQKKLAQVDFYLKPMM